MMPIATLFVGTGLMFNVAATVPTYNVKPTCRAAIDLAVGLEGIIAKRRDKPYRSGRSPDWIKVKNPDARAATRVIEGLNLTAVAPCRSNHLP